MSTMSKYQKSNDRRARTLKIACDLAEATHYQKIRRHHLAEACETSTGNISRVMGSMDEMRTLVIEYAIAHKRSTVVAQAIMDKHPAITDLTDHERRAVLEVIL